MNDNTKLQEAIKLLLESGYSIEYNHKHICYSTNTGEYHLYNFDESGNLKTNEEESFVEASDAIGKFIRHASIQK